MVLGKQALSQPKLLEPFVTRRLTAVPILFAYHIQRCFQPGGESALQNSVLPVPGGP